jgi:hypothetical protein
MSHHGPWDKGQSPPQWWETLTPRIQLEWLIGLGSFWHNLCPKTPGPSEGTIATVSQAYRKAIRVFRSGTREKGRVTRVGILMEKDGGLTQDVQAGASPRSEQCVWWGMDRRGTWSSFMFTSSKFLNNKTLIFLLRAFQVRTKQSKKQNKIQIHLQFLCVESGMKYMEFGGLFPQAILSLQTLQTVINTLNLFFWVRVSFCSPGWPGILNLPASTSWVLGLQVGLPC